MLAIDILNITPEDHPSGISYNCFKLYFFQFATFLTNYRLVLSVFFLNFILQTMSLCEPNCACLLLSLLSVAVIYFVLCNIVAPHCVSILIVETCINYLN